MTNKGFTLIELMVTVTIMLIMTAVVLFNYNQFNDSTLLSSFAYDMSLTIRQAQTYGVSTLERPGANQTLDVNLSAADNRFNSPYGAHFDSTPNLTTPFLLFADSPSGSNPDGTPVYNNIYDGSDTALQTYSFQRGIKISNLCVTVSGVCQTVQTLDITFLRPDPEATIIGNGGAISGPDVSSATITLQSSNSSVTKLIVVSKTGQISVQ